MLLPKVVLCCFLFIALSHAKKDNCNSRPETYLTIDNGYILWKDGSMANLQEIFKLIQFNIFYRRPLDCELGEERLHIMGNNAIYPLRLPAANDQTYSVPVFPRSCTEALRKRALSRSGLYLIHMPETELKPFYVYCMLDPEGGPAWTVIMRRINEKVDFEKGYEMYKAGFGGLSENFFIGLEKLYVLTTMVGPQELWVQLRSWDDREVYAKYNHFAIGDEGMRYGLTVLGEYNGTAGDSLSFHLGQKFSTHDSDYNDCVKYFRGGWWFRNCYESNLNGIYGANATYGIVWKTYKGIDVSMKYVQMAIRPAQSQTLSSNGDK